MHYATFILWFVVLSTWPSCWHSVRSLDWREGQLHPFLVDWCLFPARYRHRSISSAICSDIDLYFLHNPVTNGQYLVHRQQRICHFWVTLIIISGERLLFLVYIESIYLLHDNLLFLLFLVLKTAVFTAYVESAFGLFLLKAALIDITNWRVLQLTLSFLSPGIYCLVTFYFQVKKVGI